MVVLVPRISFCYWQLRGWDFAVRWKHVTEPCFTVPSKKYFSQMAIPSLYLQEKSVETTLAQVEYCSFTTNLLTAKYQNRRYISILSHFIDKLHSYCLETHQLPSEHTAQNIATELSQLLNVRNNVELPQTMGGTLSMQWKYLACLTSHARSHPSTGNHKL